MIKFFLVFLLFFCMGVTTGCDRREMNDIAIVLGWGMDQKDDGKYVASAQFAIPSKLANSAGGGGGGGAEDGYLLETATGKNPTDAAQNMQLKLSRTIFASHRKLIVLGEDVAKNGITNIIDEYSRNPDVRLRTDVFVVKGAKAADFLSMPYKLEKIPALGPIKIHESVGGTESATFKEFLQDASSDGINPSLPTIEIVNSGSSGNSSQSGNAKTFKITGRALFDNNLKMVGYLTPSEAKDRFFIKGELKKNVFTVNVPEGDGNISFDGSKYKSKIKPVLKGENINFIVSLSAKGMIRENNTNLDLKSSKNIAFIETALQKQIAKEVSATISHVQKDFGIDVFGFGQAVHRKYPKEWRTLKRNWNADFSEAKVTVKADITVEAVGATGPSLQLKESRIKK